MKHSGVSARFARRAVRRPAVIASVLRRALRLHAFAQRMVARHARAAARFSAAELLLARSNALFVTHLTQQYLVSLSMIEHRMSTRTVAGQAVTQILRTHSSSTAPLADERVLPHAGANGALLRELTLRRLVIERTRRDGIAPLQFSSEMLQPGHQAANSAAFASAPAGRTAPQMAALPLVKHAPAPMTAVANNAGAREARVDSSVAARAAIAAVSERDIERLTERVIGSIDRRIVAQRERFGRP